MDRPRVTPWGRASCGPTGLLEKDAMYQGCQFLPINTTQNRLIDRYAKRTCAKRIEETGSESSAAACEISAGSIFGSRRSAAMRAGRRFILVVGALAVDALKMTKKLEINGVKFSIDEIKSVTILRGGKDIYIEKPGANPGPIGFKPIELTHGMCKGGTNPPNTSNLRPPAPGGSGSC